ncbi:MAG: hypothetical protein R2746_12045 [Acidimicrobiales bacterium]
MVETPVLTSTVLDRAGAQERLLVLLHGYGEPIEQLSSRIDLLDPVGRFKVVLPHAPFERGGRAIWHRALTAREEAEAQYVASLAAIDAHLAELEEQLGLPVAEAVVGGFSQGGGLALGLLLGADVAHVPAAGFGVCSFPPVVGGFRVDPAACEGRRYFLSSAREDHFAGIEVSRSGAALLRDVGLALTYVEADGGHEMTDDVARRIGEWIAELDTGERPVLPAVLADVAGLDGYFAGLWDLVD